MIFAQSVPSKGFIIFEGVLISVVMIKTFIVVLFTDEYFYFPPPPPQKKKKKPEREPKKL